MSVLAMAGVSLRRLVRDRRALFFMLVLPVVVIVVVGATVGGFNQFRVGLVVEDQGPLARSLVTQLDDAKSLRVSVYPSEAAMRVAMRRSEITAGIEIPAGYDTSLRGGRTIGVPVLSEQANQTAQGAQAAIAAVIDDHAGTMQAAQFAVAQTDTGFGGALTRAQALTATNGRVTVSARDVNAKSAILPSGFSYSAPTMLTLFVFINALAFGATAIDNRRLGVYERALAAPIHPRSIVLGEVSVALGLTVLQSGLIVLIGATVFGVSWGNPLAASVLIVMWALVGAGAGMLSGTLFRTPQQASSIGPAIGLAFGMLGGCMWPLAIVSSTMRTVGHFTPQAWAVDAWTALLSRAGTITDILRPLAVLAAFAVALLTIAIVRIRRILIP
jgi:ABC-2 type transport system permease protein